MKSRLLFSIVAILTSAMFAISCAQSDVGITTSVKTQLADDDLVKARQINVDTQDKVVTLSGEVRSAEEEKRAIEIARKTNGVSNVVNELKVVPEAAPTTGVDTPGEPGATAPMSDAGITAAVKSKLLADPETAGLRIDVDTKDRVVILTGKVRSQAEKKNAVAIARETQGVTSVTDKLTVARQQ